MRPQNNRALPYCLERLADGRYVLLNRSYKPVGMTTTDWVDYTDHAICLPDLDPATATAMSFKGTRCWIEFSSMTDGADPTTSKTCLHTSDGRMCSIGCWWLSRNVPREAADGAAARIHQ